MIDTGSDFSGVGAFDQALERIGIKQNKIFACDMDKYARQTYIHNYGEPNYYPENVYDRKIPEKPLDIFMSSPPCQSFSLAGKRKGEEDKRGILFYNTHEFIQKNKPRYFIIENVKGLLSDDGGKTFQRWIDHLGGKTVNGNPVIFPLEDAVPYNVYYQVLNAKNYGVPQNRERIFIIGIRDDIDNNFSFPKPFHLVKRLKDVLEENVDEKYYLSDKALEYMSKPATCGYSDRLLFMNNEENETAGCVTANHRKGVTYNCLKVKSATSKGYEIATDEDSINFSQPNSETRRGRVGKGVAQTLDTACNQAVITSVQKDNLVVINNPLKCKTQENEKRNAIKILFALSKEIGEKTIETWVLRILETIREKNILRQRMHEKKIQGETKESAKGFVDKVQPTESSKEIAFIIMRSLPKEIWIRCSSQRRKSIKQLIIQLNESLQKLPLKNSQTEIYMQNRELQYESKGFRLLREALSKIQEVWKPFNGKTQSIQPNYRIRRLTVREVFRLMDFPDSFTWPVSDSQAYKQAGNSIVVNVLSEILKKLNI